MISTLLKRLCIPGFVFFAGNILYAQSPVFNSATPNNTSVAKFDKFEVNINLTAGFSNAYDYDDIVVTATFTAPTGKVDVVDGFYMQDFTADANGKLTPGAGSFRVRYAPTELGTYSYV